MAPQFILITAPGKINLYLGVHPHGTDGQAEEVRLPSRGYGYDRDRPGGYHRHGAP